MFDTKSLLSSADWWSLPQKGCGGGPVIHMSGKPYKTQLSTNWFTTVAFQTAAHALSLPRMVMGVPVCACAGASKGISSGSGAGSVPPR